MIKSAIGQSFRLTGRAVRTCLIAAGLLTWSLAALSQSQEEDLRVTVKSGDTFGGILKRELQSLDAWGEVARFNELEKPDQIRPGEVLVIPAEVLMRRHYATVVYVKGKAIHHSASEKTMQQVTKGSKVFRGDLIETARDGFVSVSFNGGSSVNIQPESAMRISLLNCIDKENACEIKLNAEKGYLGLDVQGVDFKKPTIFNIDTPYASAAVRGTRFDFDINDGNVLGVTEGKVEITYNGNRSDVDIGKGVVVADGGSIGQQIDLLGKPEIRLSDDLDKVSSEDVISWEVVSGAEKYLVTYASSESMQDVVASIDNVDNVTRPELPVGEYYLSTRAVDANGLRGFSAQKKIAVVKLDDGTQAPDLDIQVTDTEMQVKAPESASNTTEVKIGNALVEINSREYVVSTNTYLLEPGQQITIPIDSSKDWYLQNRAVMSADTVSSYGFLYVFEAPGQ